MYTYKYKRISNCNLATRTSVVFEVSQMPNFVEILNVQFLVKYFIPFPSSPFDIHQPLLRCFHQNR